MPTQVITLIVVGAIMFLVIGGLAFLSHYYTLDGIKSKTVGDGQHGTARWATKQEIRQTYAHVPFEPELWRKGEHLPEKQGLVLGCEGPKDHVTALVDTDDIHAMVTAASGAGKTAFFLYPNIEYALASGMSFLCTDTKGDLFRNYAGIAKDCYGYQIAVLDLRNPTRSDGNNLLHLINKYMDIYSKTCSNDTIITYLGMGIVWFTDPPEQPEPTDYDYEYRVDTDVITPVSYCPRRIRPSISWSA